MKFQTIALAAALTFGAAAAIAMPNDAMSPAVVKHHSTKHAVKHHGKVHHHVATVRHQHVKHAGRHHRAHMATTNRHDNDGAMSNVSREERMQQSLQKFRSNHG